MVYSEYRQVPFKVFSCRGSIVSSLKERREETVSHEMGSPDLRAIRELQTYK